MSPRTLNLDDALWRYLLDHTRESAAQARLRSAMTEHPYGAMQLAPEQGALLAFLAKLIGAARILEIGTFTGYSAQWLAGALPVGGRLTCLEASEEFAGLARAGWEEAGLADRIDLRLGMALDSLGALEAEGARFDMAFIDADKKNYPAYYEACLRLVRPGGLIALDNMLWRGAVSDAANTDKQTVVLRGLNAALVSDERVDFVLLPVGDGIALARVRD